MKFELTLTTVLVFFVPGAVLLLGFVDVLDETRATELRAMVLPPTAVGGLYFLACAFAVGAVVDSVRTLTTGPLANAIEKRCLGGGALTMDYLGKLGSADKLKLFELLVERMQEYYRLNTNLVAAFAGVVVLRMYACTYDGWFWGALVSALVFLAVSVRSRNDLVQAIANLPT